jgi:outer membrane receptor protein involved in Fe transport
MKRSTFFITAVVAAMLLAGAAAFAQEQAGGIEGVVSDQGGAQLPGVTVEAVGPAGRLAAVTDVRGEYRFPRLSPGAYTITATLEGFTTSEVTNVKLALGKILRVNFVLQAGKFLEAVTVVAEPATIDVSQSATSISITREQMDLLPKGRDFSTLVTMAPGASNETFLSGISVNGASGAENRFVIDGVDTTNPFSGLQAQPLVTDVIEEVQVKSAGYAAEYGGSLGGVINAITRSGGNEFHGAVNAYYNSSSWDGKQRPTNYEANCPPAGDCTITYRKDDSTRLEPGFQIGGPILRNKLWFYAAYQPAFTTIDRTPIGSSTSYREKDTVNYFIANLKGNAGASFLYKFAANLSPAKSDGVLPNQDGSTPSNAPLGIVTQTPRQSFSAYADWMATTNFLLTGQAGYFKTDSNQSGNVGTTRYSFVQGPIPVPTTDPRYRPTGYSNIPAASYTLSAYDLWERYEGKLEASWYVEAAGSHQIKAGVNYARATNNVLSGENGNLFRFYWGRSDPYGMGVKGTYGALAVRDYRTQGSATDTNWSIFLQDSWVVLKNLTINYGLRAEKEDVPNYGYNQDPTLPKYIARWNFGDKLAPRIGFAWDVLNNQKLKVYGSYGDYFDIMKLDMSRESFGGDRWIAYLYPLNTLDWQTINAGCTIVDNIPAHNPCPALGTPVTDDLRAPTDPRTGIDPNLKPMQQRQWTLGADYRLTPQSFVSARYVDNHLLYTIEDIGYLVCSTPTTCAEEYKTGNPGHGFVLSPSLPAGVPQQAPAIRNYKAFELSYNRRFTDNWSLTVNYTYSHLTGNYSGLASSDEFGRDNPNVERSFDGLAYGYDQNGHLVDGVLNTDRPHALQVLASYRFNFGTQIGVGQTWVSGTPVTTIADFNGVDFFPKGRGDLGRTPNITQTDLYIAQPFKVAKDINLEVSLNVINLFDQKAVTRIYSYPWRADICDVSPDCDGSSQWYFQNVVPYNVDQYMANQPKDPFYKHAYAWQAGRAVRLGLKLTF